jgi:hypothetical protein
MAIEDNGKKQRQDEQNPIGDLIRRSVRENKSEIRKKDQRFGRCNV